MKGTAEFWTQTDEYGFGVILGENGRKWRVAGGQVELDALGRCLLVPGEPVEFDEGHYTDKKQRTHPTAINVLRPWKDTESDPTTHREICKVKDRNWLLRMVGGMLSTSMERGRLGILKPGQIVECGVAECPGYSAWAATHITILARSEESFDWGAVEASNV